MGLSEGPLSRTLRTYARRYPDQDFTALREEAVLLEAEYGGMQVTDIACRAINSTCIPKPQATDWKQELKQGMLEDVKTLVQGFIKEMMDEIRPLIQAAVAAVRPCSPPPPEPYYAQPRRRYIAQQKYEWDDVGRPICWQCRKPGHMARFCRANQVRSREQPASGVPAARASPPECGAVFSVERSPAADMDRWAGSEKWRRDRDNSEMVSCVERDGYGHPTLTEETQCTDVNLVVGQGMDGTAKQQQRTYDHGAGSPSLLPGDRVWVKNYGKMGPWWNAEPFVVLEAVGKAGFVKYRVCSEEGGCERIVDQNALKVCVTPQQAGVRTEPGPERSTAGAVWPQQGGFFPGSPGCSGGADRGQPHVRYYSPSWDVAGTAND